MNIKSILFAFSIGLISFSGLYINAQTIVSDPQKRKQLNSMENGGWDFGKELIVTEGGWDFEPDWYYYIFHKKYSGAEIYWKWDGPHVRFKELKSDVMRSLVPRLGQVPAEIETLYRAREQYDTIHPLFLEEMERSADRQIDVSYFQFKDDFESLQNIISECLSFSLQKSNGKLSDLINNLQEKNQLILDEVDYIHKTGLGYELENVKRQTAYEESLNKMKDMADLAFKLMMYTKVVY